VPRGSRGRGSGAVRFLRGAWCRGPRGTAPSGGCGTRSRARARGTRGPGTRPRSGGPRARGAGARRRPAGWTRSRPGTSGTGARARPGPRRRARRDRVDRRGARRGSAGRATNHGSRAGSSAPSTTSATSAVASSTSPVRAARTQSHHARPASGRTRARSRGRRSGSTIAYTPASPHDPGRWLVRQPSPAHARSATVGSAWTSSRPAWRTNAPWTTTLMVVQAEACSSPGRWWSWVQTQAPSEKPGPRRRGSNRLVPISPRTPGNSPGRGAPHSGGRPVRARGVGSGAGRSAA
jgi:hypothetical protein